MNEDGVGGDQLIVVPIIDGIADTRVVHLPWRDVDVDESPYEMRAACGVRGVVYARGPIFSRSSECGFCVKMAAGCGRYASLDRYNDGCRCDDCKTLNARYRRALYRQQTRRKGRTCGCGGLKSPSAKTCMGCYMKNRAGCGTTSMYARGCRCDLCREAHRVYMREYMRRTYRRAA